MNEPRCHALTPTNPVYSNFSSIVPYLFISLLPTSSRVTFFPPLLLWQKEERGEKWNFWISQSRQLRVSFWQILDWYESEWGEREEKRNEYFITDNFIRGSTKSRLFSFLPRSSYWSNNWPRERASRRIKLAAGVFIASAIISRRGGRHHWMETRVRIPRPCSAE